MSTDIDPLLPLRQAAYDRDHGPRRPLKFDLDLTLLEEPRSTLIRTLLLVEGSPYHLEGYITRGRIYVISSQLEQLCPDGHAIDDEEDDCCFIRPDTLEAPEDVVHHRNHYRLPGE